MEDPREGWCTTCAGKTYDDGSCGCQDGEPERCAECGDEVGAAPLFLCSCTCRDCGSVLGAPGDGAYLCAACDAEVAEQEAPLVDEVFGRTVGALADEYPEIAGVRR